MEIIRLEGEDHRLYYLVAHLVMNEDVLKYNLNYPYKTSDNYCWFVAVEEGITRGFIPVELKDGKATINNYYVEDDDSKVFSLLLKEVVRVLLPDFNIESITQIRHIPDFERNGFSIILRWKRYVKMNAFKK
ncbi:hypothetical protein FACS1894160_2050 [Bacteroidia bacterium]|nr:hypothetical protein FACS1894123_11970 [Bacteroidia bacterium]GHV08182.1 hypothetical protein FACS1894160_2050 [Bacteroidia bacterium]